MLEALRLSWSGRTKWPVLVVAAMILVALFPGEALPALQFAAENLVLVSPMIVLGMLLTALVVASGGTALIARAFHGRQSGMILAASVIGALTPVCGMTVLPLVAGLLAAGVPLPPSWPSGLLRLLRTRAC